MRLFRISKSPPKKTPSSVATASRFSPLDLPEVLEKILSFVDRPVLARVVLLVCSRWHAVSLRILQSAVELDINETQEKRDAIVAAIPTARKLVLGSTGSLYHTNMSFEHRRLPSVVMDKCQTGISVPLQELVLGRGFATTQVLFSLLPSSKYLTKLVLRHDGYALVEIGLNTLLEAYPCLLALELSSRISSRIVLSKAQDESDIPVSNISSQLRLNSLVFVGVDVSQSFLQRLLRAAPFINDLRLWNLWIPIDGTPFDLIAFLEFILDQPWRLKSFAFSEMGEGSTQVTTTFQNTFDILEPNVHKWGFSVHLCKVLAHLPNRITTLEVKPNSHMENLDHDSGLHEFLCQSPLLLHLRASRTLMDTRYMDVNGLYAEKFTTDRSKRWACSGLQTLQLSFCSPDEEWRFGELHSRIVCGYIVRFCPKLRELNMGARFSIAFALEDGFVILARLQYLESFAFWPAQFLGLEKVLERVWAIIQPSSLDQIQQKRRTGIDWRKDLAEDVRNMGQRVPFGTSERLDGVRESPFKPWTDARYVGSLWDVKMALEDVGRDSHLEQWWPRLQSFTILVYSWADVNEYFVRRIYSRKPLLYSDTTKKRLILPMAHLIAPDE